MAVAGLMEDAASGTRRDGRERVLRALRGAAGGRSVRELAVATHLHENAVRRILARLLAGGDVLAQRAPTGARGRPLLRYRLVGAADGPFRQLVPMLLDLLDGPGDPDAAFAAGRRHGSSAPGSAAASTREAIVDSLVTLGFAPAERPSGARGLHVLDLTRCPFTDAVTAAPNGRQVCHLHHGVLAGLASATGGELEEFLINDPRVEPCRVGFRSAPEGTA